MFKKQSVIFLALVMALTLIACASGVSEDVVPTDNPEIVESAPPTEQEKYGQISLPDGYTQVDSATTQDAYMQYENAENNTVVTVVRMEVSGVSLDDVVAIFKAGLTEEEVANSSVSDSTVDGIPAKLLEITGAEGAMKSIYLFEDAASVRYIQIEHAADGIGERDSIIANYKAE